MAWYRMHYIHDDCGTSWDDEWSCACNDRCPVCRKEIEPADYIDLTGVVGFDSDANEWVVLQSPPEAEDRPDYRETRCNDMKQDLRLIDRQLGP